MSRTKKEIRHLKCKYCTRIMKFDNTTLDHVIPRSRGGSGQQSNLVVACKLCNSLKSDRVFISFLGNRGIVGEKLSPGTLVVMFNGFWVRLRNNINGASWLQSNLDPYVISSNK